MSVPLQEGQDSRALVSRLHGATPILLRFTFKLGRQWEGASRAHGKWDRVRVGGGTAPTDGTCPVTTLQTLAVVCKSQIGLQGAGYMPSNPQRPKIYWTD